jgi:hypothetical protein
MSDGEQQINTGGGTYVAGDVTTGGDFVGRDQIINQIGLSLGELNNVTRPLSDLLRLLAEGDFESASVIADLTALMEELRRTHSTIVKLVSPLRRAVADPITFVEKFRNVYFDVLEFHDTHDFLDERAHCHKIRSIRSRLLRKQSLLTTRPEWPVLDQYLAALSTADLDVIEHFYIPFVEQLLQQLGEIEQMIQAQQTGQALTAAQQIVDGLSPEFDKTKVLLREMTDTIALLDEKL